MEQAQSQASCRVPLLCLLLPKACLSSSMGKGREKGNHPTSLHSQEGSAQPWFGEMPRDQNTRAPHGHLQGPTLTPRQWVGATKCSGVQGHGTEQEQWRREHVKSSV